MQVIYANLNNRKLRFAGSSESSVFVLYVQGGFAPTVRLLIVNVASDRVVNAVEFLISGNPDDIDALKSLVPDALHPVPQS